MVDDRTYWKPRRDFYGDTTGISWGLMNIYENSWGLMGIKSTPVGCKWIS
jgi:hypothetical protein